MNRSDIVLVDACVIIEARRMGVLGAMKNSLKLETVETCIIEAQTGKANRLDLTVLDRELREGFSEIHEVSDLEIANHLISVDDDMPSIDKGELELWAHAHQKKGKWFLCGPDRASMNYGCKLGYIDRLVSMENLLKLSGIKKSEIREHYQEKWLRDFKTNLAMGIL